MATVTISDSEANIAFSIPPFDLNLPVPKNRREENSFPAITNFSILLNDYMFLYSYYPPQAALITTTWSFSANFLSSQSARGTI